MIFVKRTSFKSPEIEIAFAKIAPEKYLTEFNAKNDGLKDWRVASSYAQGLGTIAEQTDENLKTTGGQSITAYFGEILEKVSAADQSGMNKAVPDLIRAVAAYKNEMLPDLLREILTTNDIFVRAAAAELLGEQAATKENTEALKIAFAESLKTDKDYNDAQLAILSALVKLDKPQSFESLRLALTAPDYLVRKHAANLIKGKRFDEGFFKCRKNGRNRQTIQRENGNKTRTNIKYGSRLCSRRFAQKWNCQSRSDNRKRKIYD